MIKPEVAVLSAMMTVLVGLCATPAIASDQASFGCEAGDISYTVVFDGNDSVIVEESLGEMIAREPQIFVMDSQPSASGFYYAGNGYSFYGKGDEASLQEGAYPPIQCELYEPFPITQTHASGAVGGNEGPVLNHQGQSLGGKLRNGPGTNFSDVGSLSEGTWFTIVRSTGVQMDGYDWFEVALDSGERAYQWGGIMCSNGQQIAGIYAMC